MRIRAKEIRRSRKREEERLRAEIHAAKSTRTTPARPAARPARPAAKPAGTATRSATTPRAPRPKPVAAPKPAGETPAE